MNSPELSKIAEEADLKIGESIAEHIHEHYQIRNKDGSIPTGFITWTGLAESIIESVIQEVEKRTWIRNESVGADLRKKIKKLSPDFLFFDRVFMTPEEHRSRMCDRKIRYRSNSSASNAILSIHKSRLMDHTPQIYECPYCFGFHLAKRK